jgi:hypothetical protein
MPKKANLANALDEVTPAPVKTVTPAARAPVAASKPSRVGTVLVGAHLPARYGKALKLLSAETEETQAALLKEALDMLFVKKGAKLPA